MARLKRGERVKKVTLVQGDAPSSGEFTLPRSVLDVGDAYVERGLLHIEVQVTDLSREASWSTSMVRDAGGQWVPVSLEGATGSRQMAVKFDLSAGKVETGKAGTGTIRSYGEPEETIQVDKFHPQAWQKVGRAIGGVVAMEECYTLAEGWHYNRPEAFAFLYGWGGASVILDQEVGTTHTLGIARQTSSGWSLGGTKTVAFGGGASTRGLIDVQAHNRVNYRDYWDMCTNSTDRIPMGYYALNTGFPKVAHVNYSHCTRYTPTTTVWKTNGRNLTQSRGVSLGVINVSAQSGWDSKTKIQYFLSRNSYICGSEAGGWLSSRSISAKAA